MANYYGTGRSNYIHVTDLEKVKRIASCYECTVHSSDTDDKGICFLSDSESGDVENMTKWYDDDELSDLKELFPETSFEDGEYTLPDFLKTISKFMLPGEVLVWEHVGNEKMRYVNGYAAAVNSSGKTVAIYLQDIYKKAQKLGNKITPAEY